MANARYYKKMGLNAVVKNVPEYRQAKMVFEESGMIRSAEIAFRRIQCIPVQMWISLQYYRTYAVAAVAKTHQFLPQIS